jgi:hypothetical protein
MCHYCLDSVSGGSTSNFESELNRDFVQIQMSSFIFSLILTGYKRDLTREDLWQIDESESSAVLTQKLESAWNQMTEE